MQAALMHLVGHMWPADRVFEKDLLGHLLQLAKTKKKLMVNSNVVMCSLSSE